MSNITQTKLGRAKFRTGVRFLDGGKVPTNRIAGYEPPQARNIVSHPNHPELTALASPGQRINFGREAHRKGLSLYTKR